MFACPTNKTNNVVTRSFEHRGIPFSMQILVTSFLTKPCLNINVLAYIWSDHQMFNNLERSHRGLLAGNYRCISQRHETTDASNPHWTDKTTETVLANTVDDTLRLATAGFVEVALSKRTHAHTHIHTDTQTHTRIHTHTHMHIYIYIYIMRDYIFNSLLCHTTTHISGIFVCDLYENLFNYLSLTRRMFSLSLSYHWRRWSQAGFSEAGPINLPIHRECRVIYESRKQTSNQEFQQGIRFHCFFSVDIEIITHYCI